jgi:hypothetical protein
VRGDLGHDETAPEVRHIVVAEEENMREVWWVEVAWVGVCPGAAKVRVGVRVRVRRVNVREEAKEREKAKRTGRRNANGVLDEDREPEQNQWKKQGRKHCYYSLHLHPPPRLCCCYYCLVSHPIDSLKDTQREREKREREGDE